jgi:hypothetical protein
MAVAPNRPPKNPKPQTGCMVAMLVVVIVAGAVGLVG